VDGIAAHAAPAKPAANTSSRTVPSGRATIRRSWHEPAAGAALP
jgi:hypothetical protein